MRSSTPSVRASRPAAGSSRSSPRSSAKWLRVPARDNHERHVVLGGDPGDERLGAVAAGDTEQVGAVGDGLPGQLGDVDPGPVEQGDLGAELPGLAPRGRTGPTLPPPDLGFMIRNGRLGGGV